MMAGSPEEVMLYTEAMEISLALFSVCEQPRHRWKSSGLHSSQDASDIAV